MREGATAVADQVFAGARPQPDNAFKVTLAKRTLAAAISEARA